MQQVDRQDLKSLLRENKNYKLSEKYERKPQKYHSPNQGVITFIQKKNWSNKCFFHTHWLMATSVNIISKTTHHLLLILFLVISPYRFKFWLLRLSWVVRNPHSAVYDEVWSEWGYGRKSEEKDMHEVRCGIRSGNWDADVRFTVELPQY